MTIDSADQNLELYPFPSVTICSQNKISKSKLEKLLHNPRYGEFTFEQMAFIMSVMSQVHEAQNRAQDLIRINQMLDNNGIATQEIIDIINQVNNVFFYFNKILQDFIPTLLQVSIKCDEILLVCQWKENTVPCSELFASRLTDEGYCCGFNAIQTNWTLNTEEYVDALRKRIFFCQIFHFCIESSRKE